MSVSEVDWFCQYDVGVEYERQNPRKPGEKQSWWLKLIVGGGCFLLLLALLWSPLFLLSSANPTLEPNVVISSNVRMIKLSLTDHG